MTETRATTPDLLRYLADSVDWLVHRQEAVPHAKSSRRSPASSGPPSTP
ncbi:hypothetical protein [Terrabacter sp. MAHUQ-38]|nr:hypothetical protein [Terrabacter sp. MAHUQ-38]MBC9822838.1 hypothetical protein [Terrabacter sp. MAHUQ-38]